MRRPVLFFDFDNTLTPGDILDEVVETWSRDVRWRAWEADYAAGRLAARDCLQRQVENLAVPPATLLAHFARVPVDPLFAEILAWARPRRIEVIIVSDNFRPLILATLEANGVAGVPVIANELAFAEDGRLRPSFPHHDPAVTRSANAKARHLAPYGGREIVYTGDGRSDLDAALAADVVFAKDSLARELLARGVPFRAFDTLAPVLEHLRSAYSGA